MSATDDKTPTIGDRMKDYENVLASKLDPTLPWMCRLDGHKFSSYTRPFKKPFDERIHNCMVAAASALADAFNPVCVYTCSDEITLVFPVLSQHDPANEALEGDQKKQNQTIIYNGKVQKLASLMASYATVAFDREMNKQVFGDDEAKLKQHVEQVRPYFDGRVFNMPSDAEMVNNLVWRCHFDYRRNSISTFARSFFTTKELHLKSCLDMLAMIKEKGADWEDLPAQFKYGTFIKKELYDKETVVDGNVVVSKRSRAVVLHKDMAACNDNTKAFVMSKYLPEDQQWI